MGNKHSRMQKTLKKDCPECDAGKLIIKKEHRTIIVRGQELYETVQIVECLECGFSEEFSNSNCYKEFNTKV